jgi:hypothetical protein
MTGFSGQVILPVQVSHRFQFSVSITISEIEIIGRIT